MFALVNSVNLTKVHKTACQNTEKDIARTWLDFVYVIGNNEKSAFIELLNELQWTWSLPRTELLPAALIIFLGLKFLGSFWKEMIELLLILRVLGRVGLQSE